jgi:ubiquinone/menaquinone biosynthesis C-methylase UbiE
MDGSEIVNEAQRDYLPAAGRDCALPLYDPCAKLLGMDAARKALLDQAALEAGHRVLDVGCGTGTLAAEIKQLHPEVVVVGFDPDPQALARARQKAKRAAVTVQFDQGFSDALPYPDASFDRVFSSFMLHHVPENEKEKMLVEIRRVLAPGGSLHLVDLGGPEARDGRFMRRLRSAHNLQHNSEGRVLGLMQQAGLTEVKKVAERAMLFGLFRIVYYKATVPRVR